MTNNPNPTAARQEVLRSRLQKTANELREYTGEVHPYASRAISNAADLIDEADEALATLAPAPVAGGGEPVAWQFELANYFDKATGEYSRWGSPQLSSSKPYVPEGSIRNLRPLYASPPSEGWRPIETAPKDGTDILACDEDGQYVARWAAYAGGNPRWRLWWNGDPNDDLTHWQPLPAPPQPGGR